jgi:hypothetical protein
MRLCLFIGLFTFTVAVQAQTVITNGSVYTQNFNSLSSGLPQDWTVRTGATATSLGTVESFSATPVEWLGPPTTFLNLASSDNLNSNSNGLAQNGSTNRALGIRQARNGFGDPGASFNFNFSTTNTTVGEVKIDLLMLAVQSATTTWTMQYGVGNSPTTWNTFAGNGTWNDPGVFGSSPPFTLNDQVDMAAISNQANVWFRVVALTPSVSSAGRPLDTIAIDNFSITPVPEPGTIFAVGAAVLGTGAFIRRHLTAKTS